MQPCQNILKNKQTFTKDEGQRSKKNREDQSPTKRQHPKVEIHTNGSRKRQHLG